MVVFHHGFNRRKKKKQKRDGRREGRGRERERRLNNILFLLFILYLNMAPRPAAIVANFNSSTAVSRERVRQTVQLRLVRGDQSARVSPRAKGAYWSPRRRDSRHIRASFPSQRRTIGGSRIEGMSSSRFEWFIRLFHVWRTARYSATEASTTGPSYSRTSPNVRRKIPC